MQKKIKRKLKEMISIAVLLLAAVMLTACGTKEDLGTNGNNPVEVVSATEKNITVQAS